MAAVRHSTMAQKIFNNVLFLAEAFGHRPDQDIPKIPVLEMAKCFDLVPLGPRTSRRRPPDWPLWK